MTGCSRCRYSKRGCDRCRSASTSTRSAASRSPPPKKLRLESAHPVVGEVRKREPDMEMIFSHLLSLVKSGFGVVLDESFVYEQAKMLAKMYTKAMLAVRAAAGLAPIEIRLERRIGAAICAEYFAASFTEDDVANVANFVVERISRDFGAHMTLRECKEQCDSLLDSALYEIALQKTCPGNLALPMGHAFHHHVIDMIYQIRMLHTAMPHASSIKIRKQ